MWLQPLSITKTKNMRKDIREIEQKCTGKYYSLKYLGVPLSYLFQGQSANDYLLLVSAFLLFVGNSNDFFPSFYVIPSSLLGKLIDVRLFDPSENLGLGLVR